LNEIGHLATNDNRPNLPWCLSLREKREQTAAQIPTGSNNTEVHNRLYETTTKSFISQQGEKFKYSFVNGQNGLTSPISVTLGPNSNNTGVTTPRSGFGFNSIISNSSINSKRWVNSAVQSPKLTSHNFPDNLPTELISHFYKSNDEKLKSSSISLNTLNDCSKFKFNSKIENNKTFKQAKLCSKGHQHETDERFKSDI